MSLGVISGSGLASIAALLRFDVRRRPSPLGRRQRRGARDGRACRSSARGRLLPVYSASTTRGASRLPAALTSIRISPSPALFVLVLLAALLSIDETWLPPALRPRRPRRAGQSASKGVLSNERRSPRKGVDMTPALGTRQPSSRAEPADDRAPTLRRPRAL